MAGHGAEDQTFAGGLSFMSFSLWTVGMTQTGRPPCQMGYKPAPTGQSRNLFFTCAKRKTKLWRRHKSELSITTLRKHQLLGPRATGFKAKPLTMADKAEGPTGGSQQIRDT